LRSADGPAWGQLRSQDRSINALKNAIPGDLQKPLLVSLELAPDERFPRVSGLAGSV
jgi:hypothetical protein